MLLHDCPLTARDLVLFLLDGDVTERITGGNDVQKASQRIGKGETIRGRGAVIQNTCNASQS